MNTGLDALSAASKKVAHKAAEAIGKFIQNIIIDKIVKPKHVIDEYPISAEEISIPPEKREKILSELWQLL